MSIEWISVNQRVPDDRRYVMAWGSVFGPVGPPRSHFLGSTRCNSTREGHRFECERSDGWWFTPRAIVTHWAEIEGPDESVAQPPKKP